MPDILAMRSQTDSPGARSLSMPRLRVQFKLVDSQTQKQTLGDFTVAGVRFPDDLIAQGSAADWDAFFSFITPWLIAWRSGQPLPGS